MKKRLNIYLLFCVAATVVLAGCNKTVKFSERLSDSNWNVTELVIDGVSQDELPTLEFKACEDIYAAVCEGHWVDDHGDEGEFLWQLRSSNDEFELSYTAEEEEGEEHNHDHENQAIGIMLANLSGVYTYADFTKTDITLTSTATGGYPGKLVTMKWKKQ